MTDATTMTLMQLQYCPLCHHLIRPSMYHNNEAVQKDGIFFHATCLAKGERASGRAPVSNVDSDDDEVATTDFQNYDKVVVESITAIRNRAPGATGVRTGGTGAHAAVRRKTTTSAATASARLDDPPAARRSSMVLRSYTEPREKKSPAVLVGAVVGAVILIGAGAFFLLNSAPKPVEPPETAAVTQPRPTPRVPLPAVPAVTPTRDPAVVPPGPATTTPVDPEPSPYQIAKINNPPAVTRPAYEPAGPTVAWFDGTSLGEWKVAKSEPNAVSVAGGAIEIKPGSSPAFLEHSLPNPDFNLTFEARMGEGNQGVYMELWALDGIVKLTGADFQSAEWTPVRVEGRGGKITAFHGTKGPGNEHPAAVENSTVVSDRTNWMAGRPVLMLFTSSAASKSIRNIQYTPMRPVASVPITPTTPVIPAVPGGKTPLALPLTIPGSKLEQDWGAWRRARLENEGDTTFVTWEQNGNANQHMFFEWTAQQGVAPAQVQLRLHYRARNSDAKQLTIRFWYSGGGTSEVNIPIPSFETWNTAEVIMDTTPEQLEQAEIRLQGTIQTNTHMDVASLVISAVHGAVAVVPTATPTPTPPPAIPAPTPPVAPDIPEAPHSLPQVGTNPVEFLPFTLGPKDMTSAAGEWRRMSVKTEDGKPFLSWVAPEGKNHQYPYFKLASKAMALPNTIKVRMIYRVNNYAGQNVGFRVYIDGKYLTGILPAGAKGVWQDGECTITGINGTTNQYEIRCLQEETLGATTIDIQSIVITDATTPGAGAPAAVQTPAPAPTPAPAAPAAPTLKLDGAQMAEAGGTWNRTTPMMEKGATFMRWTSAALFPYFNNANNTAIPLNAHVRMMVRLKPYTEKFLYIRMYSNGAPNVDTVMTLSAPNAEGWSVAEAALKNSYTSVREFEIKPAGTFAANLVMDIDSIEFLASPPPAVAHPVPAPTVPQTVPTPGPAASTGTLLFRLEGIIQEKIGRWNRVGEFTVDGRTFVTYTEVNDKHPPPFMTFQNPGSRAMPARIRVRMCFRVNKPIINLRALFSGPGREQLILTSPVGADDVGKWIETEGIHAPVAGGKDEIFFKLGDYPAGFALDIDWLEVYDLTTAAPAVPTPGPVTAPGTTPAPTVPVPAGPKPGTRIFGQPAGSKKLTKPDTKVVFSPLSTNSIASGATTAKLFDGDAAGGIFSVTSTDPKTAECWMVVDLGAMHAVDGIKLFNFFTAERTYGAQVWQVCPYDDFLRDVVTVYNADAANVHRQGAGTDPGGKAVKEGTQAFFSPVRGRYVRIWCNGNNDNKDNHILELEIYGSDSTAGLAIAPHQAAGDLKINGGRGALGDWVSAGPYVANGIDQTDAKPVVLPVGLVVPEKLYNSYRGGNQTWNFPKLANGNYWVRLHFSDPTMVAAGGRMFDIIVNEETAFKGYDIFAAAGGARRAVVETVAAVAMDGKGIKVELKTVKGAPLLCGIEILPTDGPIAAPARITAPVAPAAPTGPGAPAPAVP